MNKQAFVEGYLDKSAVDPRGRAFSKKVEGQTKQKAGVAGSIFGSPSDRVGLTPGQDLTTFNAEKKKTGVKKPMKMMNSLQAGQNFLDKSNKGIAPGQK